MSHNKIRKDILKRKINLLLTGGNLHEYIVNEVLTDELVEFVFETSGDELHYL